MPRRTRRAVQRVINAFRRLDDDFRLAVRVERFELELLDDEQPARQRLRFRAGQPRLHLLLVRRLRSIRPT